VLEKLKTWFDSEPPVVARDLALKKQGDQHLSRREFDEALACYRQAISINPGFADAYVGLGFSLVEQRKFGEAAVELERALSIDPTLADVHYLLGTTSKARDDEAGAIRHFTKALELKPDFEFAYRDLFNLLLECGKTEDAKAVIKKAILAFPRSAEFHFFLGNLLFNEVDFFGAILYHGKAAALEPTAAMPYKIMGDAHVRLDNRKKAIECYEKAISMDPANGDAYAALGAAMNASGKIEKSIASYRRAIELKPDAVEAHRFLGNILLERGDNEGAISCYRRVVELQPDSPVAHLVAAMSGKNSDRAPSAYVAQLFDEYAQTFDSHLVQTLRYDVPKKLIELVREAATPAAGQWSVLDLGCGTGLSGAAVSPYAKELVGVDLSGNMLAKAKARGIYSRLEHMDLLAMMQKEAADSYDMALSTDVLVYIGRLDELFCEAQRLLRAGGLFAFSVESLDAITDKTPDLPDARDFRLNTTGRYTHSLDYVTRTGSNHGFELLSTKEMQVRVEYGRAVSGYLMLWRRNGGTALPG
jgi:predicted TPR repeat methyltransferase